MNSFEFKKYEYLYEVFAIYDLELREYLSKVTSKHYVKELHFIRKYDVIEYYVEIFNLNNVKDELKNKLIQLENEFKSITTPVEIENYNNNYEGHYGC